MVLTDGVPMGWFLPCMSVTVTLILLDKIGHAVPCKMPRVRLLEQLEALPDR